MSKKAKKQPKRDPIRRKCPMCQKYVNVGVRDLKVYRCPDCRIQFDDDPDEGSDYGDDPTWRIQNQERHASRRFNRRTR